MKGAALTAVAATVASFSSAASAVMIETYTQVVGGQSACSTFVVAPPVLARFGATGSGLPLGGLAACGVPGSFILVTTTVGPVIDTTSLGPTAITSSFGSGTFQGSASAVANYGSIGAQGIASLTGPTDAFTLSGADAYGRFSDAFSFGANAFHPLGSIGFAQFEFTVDGALTFNSLGGPSAGQGRVELSYQQDANPIFTIFTANAGAGGTLASIATSGVSNFVTSVIPGISESVSGNATVDTFLLPFLYGTPFDFDLGLFVSAGPRARSAIDASFLTTALLSGISVFDSSGAHVDDFSITSGSGTIYDASGVHLISTPGPVPVPEPMMLSLFAVGLLAFRYRCSFKHVR
jgi:hypothetical protein